MLLIWTASPSLLMGPPRRKEWIFHWLSGDSTVEIGIFIHLNWRQKRAVQTQLENNNNFSFSIQTSFFYKMYFRFYRAKGTDVIINTLKQVTFVAHRLLIQFIIKPIYFNYIKIKLTQKISHLLIFLVNICQTFIFSILINKIFNAFSSSSI